MNTSRESDFQLPSPLAETVRSIAGAPLDATAIERVRQRARLLGETIKAQSTQSPGNVGMIKTRRVRARRVRLAAAALLLVGLGVMLLTGEATAIAQVAKALRQVTSATYTVTQQVGDRAGEITKVMLRDGVARAERPDGSVFVFDQKRKRLLRLNPATKTGTLTEGATIKGNLDIADFFSDVSNHAAKVQPVVADREFGGKRAKGFVVDASGVEYNVWVDPETSLPLHFEFERKQKIPSVVGRETDIAIKETWSDFRFNEKLNVALFTADPPKDYTIKMQRIDDRKKQLEQQKQRVEEVLRKASTKQQ
jgi:outer membrane lipoprotein-sorting protein